jgi:hypothetical protein
MSSQIDLVKFEESSGDLKWLPMVAAAFLRQMPKWREDFDAALAASNGTLQLDLLHKLRGACYAVASYKTVEVIARSEALHRRGKSLAPVRLLNQLALVETELQAIIDNPPP